MAGYSCHPLLSGLALTSPFRANLILFLQIYAINKRVN